MRYIFTALHKEPEQALNYRAPFWSNQYNTVSLLTSTLPAGFKLLVREHRLNAGRRPTRFYRELSRLPGVVLVDGFDDQFKYIANADLVVTDNSSIGWEALLLGRRVITLAETFYSAAGLARRVREPEGLAAAVLEYLQEPTIADAAAHDRALGWLLDAEWETTAPTAAAGAVRNFELLAGSLGGVGHASAPLQVAG
jgi:CDP-glycerol glycerophosphotransferase (TagB/SpsB family)